MQRLYGEETSAMTQKINKSAINIPMLAENCIGELNKHRIGEPSDDQYSLQLLCRALRQHDSIAWQAMQQCFNRLMHYWMHTHPMRELACHFDSEENYVAQGFARFWQT